MPAVFLHNIVDNTTGKTWREINLEKTHNIPLGTLVEINCEYHHKHGLRLFVAKHSRDCDGTPLFGLSFEDLTYKRNMIDLKKSVGYSEYQINDMISGNWSEDALIIIRNPASHSGQY